MAEPPDAPRRRLPAKGRPPARRPGPRPGAPPGLLRPAAGALVPAVAEGPSAADLAPATAEAGFRGGWRIVASKELADHVTSVRFSILLVLAGLLAAGSVYGASSALQSVAGQIARQPELLPSPFLSLLTVPPQVSGQTLFSLVQLIALLGPFLGILFAFDSVSSERSERTLPRLLAQPIHRDDVINGKFTAGLAAVGGIVVAVVLLVLGLGLLQLGVIPSPGDFVRLALWLVVTIVYIGLWLAFATLCSVVLRRAAPAALVAFALWLVLTLFGSLLVGIVAGVLSPVPSDATSDQQLANAVLQVDLGRISPGVIYQEATQALLDPTARTVGIATATQLDRAVIGVLPLDQSLLIVWPQVTALVAETAVCFAAAYIGFMRQEVRA